MNAALPESCTSVFQFSGVSSTAAPEAPAAAGAIDVDANEPQPNTFAW